MSASSNDKEKDNRLLPQRLEEISEDQLASYFQNFLRIEQYWKIKQGKQLLNLFKDCEEDSTLQRTTKKIIIFFGHAEGEGKVCTLQFIKELVQLGHLKVFLEIQKNFIQVFIDCITYRQHIKTISRGSTFFLQKINKNLTE